MTADLLTTAALSVLAVGFAVGIVVGLTGMGGGALMTPALIFLGVPPASAVANDLVASAVTRSTGAIVHWRSGSVHAPLVRYLVMGSVPAALVGAAATGLIGDADAWLPVVIGATLMLAAGAYVLRLYVGLRHGGRQHGGRQHVGPRPGTGAASWAVRPVATVAIGAGGGLLVGLTSVGSGSLMMVSLLLLYPALTARRLVGTDTVQAIPLVVAAAIGHVVISGVDWSVLIPLLVGGTPGTYLGARLAAFVPQGVVRRGIVLVLSLTALTLFGVPLGWVAAIGAALVILGPAAWALVRRGVMTR